MVMKLAEGIEKRCFQVAERTPEVAVPPETRPRIWVMAKVGAGPVSAAEQIERNKTVPVFRQRGNRDESMLQNSASCDRMFTAMIVLM